MPLDQRSDLFSLGVVLWEMTCGRALFRRDNDVAMMYALVEERIPQAVGQGRGLPAGSRGRRDEGARARPRAALPQDALELANELRKLAREHGWDIEGPALAKLVRDQVPDDQVAFGRIGSDKFTGPETPLPRTSGLYAAVEIVTPSLRRRSHRRAVVVTIGVMLLLSSLFWILLVPHLI